MQKLEKYLVNPENLLAIDIYFKVRGSFHGGGKKQSNI